MCSPSACLAASLVCIGLVASAAFAQRRPEATPTPAPSDEGKPSEKKPGGTDEKPPKEEKPSVTHHEVRIDGKPLRLLARRRTATGSCLSRRS